MKHENTTDDSSKVVQTFLFTSKMDKINNSAKRGLPPPNPILNYTVLTKGIVIYRKNIFFHSPCTKLSNRFNKILLGSFA